MPHRLFFTYNRPQNVDNHYVVGAGVGSKSRFVRSALRRRSNNNAQGKPCCFPMPKTMDNILSKTSKKITLEETGDPSEGIGIIMAGECYSIEGCTEDKGAMSLSINSPLTFDASTNTPPFAVATLIGITSDTITRPYQGKSLTDLLSVEIVSNDYNFITNPSMQPGPQGLGHFDIVNNTQGSPSLGKIVCSFDITVAVGPLGPGDSGPIFIENIDFKDPNAYQGKEFIINLIGPSGPGYSVSAPIYSFSFIIFQ